MTTNPYTLARAVYSSEPCERTLDEDILLWTLDQRGYVFSTPEFLVLLSRPDDSGGMPPRYHIHLLAGDIKRAVACIYLTLPYRSWISYERFGKTRVYPTDRLLKRLGLTSGALKDIHGGSCSLYYTQTV